MHKDLIRGNFEVELVGEIAMGKRRTLGMIAYRHTEVGGEIYLHWTEPKKKHLGIGTLMVTDVRQMVANRDRRIIMVSVPPLRGMEEFYRKMGFHKCTEHCHDETQDL